MPNTHRRRRRDETVLSRRVGGVYTNSQLVGDSFVVSSVWTHPSAVVTHWLQNCKLAADGCFVRSNPSAVAENSCTHRRRRRDKTVSSRRRCVLGLNQLSAAKLKYRPAVQSLEEKINNYYSQSGALVNECNHCECNDILLSASDICWETFEYLPSKLETSTTLTT